MQCKARGCTEKSKSSEEIYCEMTAADCTSLVTSPFLKKKQNKFCIVGRFVTVNGVS